MTLPLLARALVVAVALTLGSSCAFWNPRPAEVLWVPDGATISRDILGPLFIVNDRSVYRDGSISVGFTATIDRDEITSRLVQHLEGLGWRQRTTQYLNPTMATSFDDGWEHHCACIRQTGADGRPLPQAHIETWTGEWESLTGDVIRYSLTSLDSKTDGYASYIPARIVRTSQLRVQGLRR